MIRYYAVRVRPLHEFKVAEKLKALGDDDGSVKAFLPRETIRRRVSAGKFREIDRPVVPGLVFVGVIGQLPWAVTTIPGCTGWHRRSDGSPIEIPAVAIHRLREIETEIADLAVQWARRSGTIYRRGDRVRLKDGALAGRLAEVRKARRDQLRVVLEMLGAEREVVVSVASVEAAA